MATNRFAVRQTRCATSIEPRLRRRVWLPSLLLAAVSLLWSMSPLFPRQNQASIEEQIAQNIVRQPIGAAQTVGELGLPDSFVRRVADRIVRSSYQAQYHLVSGEVVPPEDGVPTTALNPKSIEAVTLRVCDPATVSEELKAYRERMPLGRPFVRGFRLGRGLWPYDDPAAHPVEARRETALLVARSLPVRGLVVTTALAIESLGPHDYIRARTPQLTRLQEVGIPIDLLEFFDRHGSGLALVRDIAQRIVAGSSVEDLESELSAIAFEFRASDRRFAAVSEAGDAPVQDIRVQLTRGDSWGKLDDGGSVEITRQILTALPDTRVTAHIEGKYIEVLRESLAGLTPAQRARMTVVPATTVVSQWAQDNGKAGSVDGKSATLVPRYANRREDGSEFIEGEAYLFDALVAAGHRVVQSPLLFQGGDVLIASRPSLGQRWAFIGEAEIYRNVSLGLSYPQVLEAFRIELGVDRCVVLPSVSFHIDYDVSFRVVDGALVALVNDRDTAVDHIIRAGIAVLERAAFLTPTVAQELRSSLDAAGEDVAKRKPFFHRLSELVYARVDSSGAFPTAFVRHFSDRDLHRAIGNFARFLTAIDIYIGDSFSARESARTGHQFALLRSYRRQKELAGELQALLVSHGIRVVAVPSLSDGERSVTAINGVHLPGLYLRPVYGGLFESLDQAAKATIVSALGDKVRIVDIQCAESQRRNGAVHCSIAPYPAPIVEN